MLKIEVKITFDNSQYFECKLKRMDKKSNYFVVPEERKLLNILENYEFKAKLQVLAE